MEGLLHAFLILPVGKINLTWLEGTIYPLIFPHWSYSSMGFYCNEEIMTKSTYREKRLFKLTVPEFKSSSQQGMMAVDHSQLRANLPDHKQREWVQNGVSL